MHSKTKKVEWLAWKVQSEVGGHEEGEKVGWHQSGKVIYVISSISWYFLPVPLHTALFVLLRTILSILFLDLRHVLAPSSND